MDDHQQTEELRKRAAAQKKVELQQQQKAALHCLQLQKALGAELLMVKSNIDHRLFERNAYVVYDHERAAYCIRSDYLGRVPRFDGKEFQTMFRVSRSRFQRIMEDIGSTEDPFYTNIVDGAGREGASFEARLMLPLKSMAYGVPPHCFRDYFQMSKTLANKCVSKFHAKMKEVYQQEYLRLPTKEDLQQIVKLHRVRHGVNGMFGSLDCMHTWWKNCPTAWKGQFKGKEKRCTTVLEAVCDHHLWFWHAACGFAGTLNDLNTLNLSPLMSRTVNGTFAKVEKDVVPFEIAEEQFNELFMLVDGIYPSYARFVKGIKQPLTPTEKSFTDWQESARKDIERAFGVLQMQWQCTSRPIFLMKMDAIGNMMAASLILHNMCVSDRVMGNVRARYNPAYNLEEDKMDQHKVRQPFDLNRRQTLTSSTTNASTTHCSRNRDVYNLVTGDRWDQLRSTEECLRLTEALMRLKKKDE